MFVNLVEEGVNLLELLCCYYVIIVLMSRVKSIWWMVLRGLLFSMDEMKFIVYFGFLLMRELF